MAGAYSARVMSGRGGNRKETFVVPPDRRLVILHVFVGVWTTTPSSVRIDVHGIAVWFLPNTVGPASFDVSTRLTAFEGETVATFIYGPDCSYAVDGYLLTDPDGRPTDADNTIEPVLLKPAVPA